MRREIGVQRAKARRVQAPSDHGLSGWEVRVVLAFYRLAGHGPQCAAAWLWRRVGSRRCWPDDGKMSSLERIVEDEFLASSTSPGHALDALGRAGSRARSVATAFFHDWQLAHWVATVNTTAGSAPSSSMLSARAGRVAHDSSGEPVAPQGVNLTAASRVWAWRWRRRNGARMAKPGQRDLVSLDEMRAKAPRLAAPAPKMRAPKPFRRARKVRPAAAGRPRFLRFCGPSFVTALRAQK